MDLVARLTHRKKEGKRKRESQSESIASGFRDFVFAGWAIWLLLFRAQVLTSFGCFIWVDVVGAGAGTFLLVYRLVGLPCWAQDRSWWLLS